MTNQEYLIDSNTTPGKQYLVFNSIHKGFICECRHFSLFHTECSHIREAKRRGKN